MVRFLQPILDQGAARAPALSFNGTTDVVNCGSGLGVDNLLVGDFTVEAWVKYAVVGDNFGHIVAKGNYNTGWVLMRQGLNDAATFKVNRATTDQNINSLSNTVRVGEWVHLAGTWDSSAETIKLFINGISVGTNNTGSGAVLDDSAETLFIGSSSNGISHSGLIGWVRISNVVRYIGSFAPDVRKVPPAIDANTVAQWNMNAGTGSTVADNSGNGHNGAITGAQWVID